MELLEERPELLEKVQVITLAGRLFSQLSPVLALELLLSF